MCYWENQLSRQAEHSSFHLFFPISEMFRGVHKQLRILKVTTVKQTKIYQKCVWGGSSSLWRSDVKHRNGSVKISPQSLFSSQHVELQPWFPGSPSHTRFPPHPVCAALNPHSVPPPASSQFTPNPFFPCSALQHQHSAAQGEQFSFHIALGTSSKAASLSVGTVGDILCEHEAVCVYREQKRAQFAF